MIRWVYARLVRLYPAGFRAAFGDELQAVFDLALRDAAMHNRAAVVRLCLRELRDLPQRAIEEHYEEKGMKMFKFPYGVWAAFGAVFSLIAAALFSVLMWGYPVSAPSPDPALAAFAEVDGVHLVAFGGADEPLSVMREAGLPQGEVTDYPPSRAIAALDGRLPAHDTPPDAARLAAVTERLRWYGVETGLTPLFDVTFLQDGRLNTDFSDTTMTFTPDDLSYYMAIGGASGYLIEGASVTGEPLVFVNLASRVGNDRYQYYELLLTPAAGGALEVVSSQQYRYDVAGLEIFNFPVIAGVLFVMMVIVFALVMAAWWGMRGVYSAMRPRFVRAAL